LVFDSPTQQTLKSTDMNNLESIDRNLDTLPFPTSDDCSTKLLTLLRSINLEKYWSTFERNEVYHLLISSNNKKKTKF